MRAKTRKTLSIYWQHAKKYPWAITALVFGMVGAVAFSTYVPFWYKRLFNVLSANGVEAVPQLINILWIILALSFVVWLFWRVAVFTNNYFQPRVMADLTNTCFAYLHGHSYDFFNDNFVGSLVKKVSRFTRSFEGIADEIYWHVGHTALRVTFIFGVLFWLYWQVALVLLVWSVTYVFVQLWFAKFKMPYDAKRAKLDTKIGGHLADTVTNNLNLKLFGGFTPEFSRHKKMNEEAFRLRKYTWDLDEYMNAAQGVFMILLEFGIFYVAVRFWQRGLLTIGDFALIQAYLLAIFHHFWDIGKQIRRLYEHMALAEEMTEILDKPHQVEDQPEAKILKAPKGGIEFKKVNFGYHSQSDVFKNFNLKIPAGQKMALIGPSGGGKSTIVKMLFRFMDINGGEILIDGQNIAEVTQESLRQNLALVPQEPVLFHRSLMENIRYAKPNASDKEVFEAARLAHCAEFIERLPKKYGTYVGERGIKLSGGERQRVAIARAILKNAPILVLDEATSSLDSESEMFIQDALEKLMKDKTTIVIAHRLSTIMKMDRIVVIDNGKIAEEGKHEELLRAKQGIYQKLWEIQAGGFEA